MTFPGSIAVSGCPQLKEITVIFCIVLKMKPIYPNLTNDPKFVNIKQKDWW